jgi:hypothetical protein
VVRLRAAKAKTIKEQDVTEALKVFDKDGNGYIKTDEVKRILSQLGEKLSAREVEAIIAEADPRRSGQVPYDFFVGMVGPPPPRLSAAEAPAWWHIVLCRAAAGGCGTLLTWLCMCSLGQGVLSGLCPL